MRLLEVPDNENGLSHYAYVPALAPYVALSVNRVAFLISAATENSKAACASTAVSLEITGRKGRGFNGMGELLAMAII